MEKVKYVCNLCGQPIILKEPNNPTNGWLHTVAGSASKCHKAWQRTHPEIPDMLTRYGEYDAYNPEGYWKNFYGVPVNEDLKLYKPPQVIKRDIIIWKI